MSNIVTKPWGREIIFTNPDSPYTGKIINIKAGFKWSLQYHDQKSETFSLFVGQANLVIGKDANNLQTIPMVIGEGYEITPGTIHRVIAITDCTVFEVSTAEIGTTYRLEDDNNRSNETPDVRNLPNRGWDKK